MKIILKLSKKFLSFLLIIIFPIMNYAAVSISDGSLFVSKSEMTADLNNISNRISRMKAHLILK